MNIVSASGTDEKDVSRSGQGQTSGAAWGDELIKGRRASRRARVRPTRARPMARLLMTYAWRMIFEGIKNGVSTNFEGIKRTARSVARS